MTTVTSILTTHKVSFPQYVAVDDFKLCAEASAPAACTNPNLVDLGLISRKGSFSGGSGAWALTGGATGDLFGPTDSGNFLWWEYPPAANIVIQAQVCG